MGRRGDRVGHMSLNQNCFFILWLFLETGQARNRFICSEGTYESHLTFVRRLRPCHCSLVASWEGDGGCRKRHPSRRREPGSRPHPQSPFLHTWG